MSQMTDRELLDMAAKAVGITLDFTVRGDFPPYYINERGGHSSWNPLTDDGDALRLAVTLRIVIVHAPSYVVAMYEGGKREVSQHEDNGADPSAATRRAIVRAAAAVGNSGGQS